MKRRQALTMLGAACAAPQALRAQVCPDKPVRSVLSRPAGSARWAAITREIGVLPE